MCGPAQEAVVRHGKPNKLQGDTGDTEDSVKAVVTDQQALSQAKQADALCVSVTQDNWRLRGSCPDKGQEGGARFLSAVRMSREQEGAGAGQGAAEGV